MGDGLLSCYTAAAEGKSGKKGKYSKHTYMELLEKALRIHSQHKGNLKCVKGGKNIHFELMEKEDAKEKNCKKLVKHAGGKNNRILCDCFHS